LLSCRMISRANAPQLISLRAMCWCRSGMLRIRAILRRRSQSWSAFARRC